METPPPFAPPGPQPQKKSKAGLIIALVIAALGICCVLPIGLLGYGAFWGFKKVSGLATCAIGFVEVQEAIVKYADEHGGKLPKAETWQDDVRPYFAQVAKDKKDQMGPFAAFSADGDWVCTDDQKHQTGIAFNEALSGKKISDISDPYGTPLIFEVNQTGTNLHMKFKPIPKSEGPSIFGERREGIVFHVKEVRHKNGDFNFTIDDQKDSKSGSSKNGGDNGDNP